MRPRGEALRFFREVLSRAPSDECLIWPYNRNKKGYALFGKQEGSVHSMLVSRVMCAEIHGMPPTPRHESAHSCGRGHDGCVNPGHLSWKTREENKADELLHGTRNRGERNGRSRLTAAQVMQIKALISEGVSSRTIAKDFGIDRSLVSNIKTGKLWGHLWPNTSD